MYLLRGGFGRSVRRLPAGSGGVFGGRSGGGPPARLSWPGRVRPAQGPTSRQGLGRRPSRPRLAYWCARSFAGCALAAVLLLVFAALFALPEQARAQSDCPADATWCATMTVGTSDVSTAHVRAEAWGFRASTSFGSLSPATFSHRGVDYTVTVVLLARLTELATNIVTTHSLDLQVTGGTLPDGTVLKVDGRTAALTVGTDSATTRVGAELWNLRTLGDPPEWVDGQQVTVSLTLPPAVLTAAEADGASLALTFDGSLDRNSVPGGRAFLVRADGQAIPVSGVAVSGATVTLTLERPVRAGSTVTVSYGAPSSKALQGTNGRRLADFTDVPVTNATTTSCGTGDPCATLTALGWKSDRTNDEYELRYFFEVTFSQALPVTEREMREDVFRMTGTDYWHRLFAPRVTEARPLDEHTVTHNGRTRTVASKWRITVQPLSYDALTVSFRKPRCHLPGAVCNLDNTQLTNAPSLTMSWQTLPATEPGNPTPTVTVEDASAPENSGRMAFTVRLSEPYRLPIWGRFRTIRGGTAKGVRRILGSYESEEGRDYWTAFREFIYIPAGKTTATMYVKLVDDSRDEPDETFKVQISELETVDGAPVGIAPPGEATGTITAPSSQQQSQAALRAKFLDEPVSHDGENAFTVRLEFTQDVEISPEDLRDHVLSARGGTVTGVSRVDGAKDLFEVTVEPDGEGLVSVLLVPASSTCTDEGAVCTAGAVALTGLYATGVRGPGPGLTVADAQANESDENASLDFVVTLSPAAEETVTVQYATSDGTATEPDDYSARSGTLTFEAGDTTKTVSVPVIDDSVEDDGETVTFTLSGATEGVAIDDGTAIGTIHNTEALTASFSGTPDEHDGETAFTFTLTFSEDVGGLSYKTLRDEALVVTGGRATRAIRVTRGSNRTWTIHVEPDGDGAVDIALPATTDCAAAGAICASDGRMLAEPVSESVPGPVPATPVTPASESLTATFTRVPDEHDGETAFTFRVKFSAALPEGSKGQLRRALSVTGGTKKRIWRVSGRLDLWQVKIKPSGHEAVTIVLSETADCAAAGAICDGDARKLSPAVTETVEGLPGLSVADAEVNEGAANAALAFVVTLSREASGTVTVAYATEDDTAVAPGDYTSRNATLTFDEGETTKTVLVPVHGDALDEGDETLTLTLSNASGAYLADAEATGTIVNTGPIPQAWLGRFGRTVADQVLEVVEGRLRVSRSAGAEIALGGQRIGLGPLFGEASDDGVDAKAALSGGAADAEETVRLKAVADWLNGEDAEEGAQANRTRSMTAREVLLDSSFSLAGQMEDGGFAALWGRIAQSRFAGNDGPLSVDGDVTTGLLGMDYAQNRWSTGLVVSRSTGTGGYSGAGAGRIEADVTAVTPWAGYAASETLSLWAAAGYGAGGLTVKPENQPALTADLSLALAAGGLRATLVEGEGPRLDAVTGARWVRTTSARLSSSAGNLAAAQADVWRVTLGLDGSWPLALGDEAAGKGATATPRLALGLRHDGGDAETGYGVDIAGGIDFALPAHGLTASLSGRGVLTHEAAGLSDRGIAGTLSWTPRASGRGPSLALTQAFGAGASSGKDALLARETLEGLAANDNGDEFEQRRLEARFGYGVAMFGDRFTGTPEIALGLSQAGRDYSLGWKLVNAGAGTGSLELSLEATRRERVNDDAPPEHGVGLRLTARW